MRKYSIRRALGVFFVSTRQRRRRERDDNTRKHPITDASAKKKHPENNKLNVRNETSCLVLVISLFRKTFFTLNHSLILSVYLTTYSSPPFQNSIKKSLTRFRLYRHVCLSHQQSHDRHDKEDFRPFSQEIIDKESDLEIASIIFVCSMTLSRAIINCRL